MMTKTILKALLASSLLLFTPVNAQTTLNWDPPTTQQGGCVPEPIQGLAGYRIWMLVADVADPTTTSYQVTDLEPGEWTFAATAYNEGGGESMLSNHRARVVGPPVVVDTVVKVPVRIKDAVVMAPAGTIPLGAECSADQTLNGHHMVPSGAVTWTGSVRSITAYATCGYPEQ